MRDGQLDVARIAAKMLTCKAALKRMAACRRPPTEPAAAAAAEDGEVGSVAEMQRRYLDRFRN